MPHRCHGLDTPALVLLFCSYDSLFSLSPQDSQTIPADYIACQHAANCPYFDILSFVSYLHTNYLKKLNNGGKSGHWCDALFLFTPPKNKKKRKKWCDDMDMMPWWVMGACKGILAVFRFVTFLFLIFSFSGHSILVNSFNIVYSLFFLIIFHKQKYTTKDSIIRINIIYAYLSTSYPQVIHMLSTEILI